MTVEWTNTFRQDFDLDYAIEVFNTIINRDPTKDLDSAIYDAIELSFYFEAPEYIDYSEAVEICAEAMRERIGGVQMRMELD